MGTYYTAHSIEDAQRSLRQSDGSAAVIAGGQELMLDIRRGAMNPGHLVDISDVDELNRVFQTADDIRMGACVTYRELETDPVIRSELPSFVAAVEDIAGPQIRNNGTLGGALCDADPVFDMPAVLLALDASVAATADGETRTVPVSSFYTGHRETALDPDEILTTILVPKPPERSAGAYRSMTPREGDSTVAGVAVRLDFDADGACRLARIGLTNAGDVPARATDAESVLEGERIDDTRIDDAVAVLRAGLDLREDALSSSAYREEVFARLTARAIRDVRDDVVEGHR